MKLNTSQVQWIIREKTKGEKTNSEIAETMKVSTRGVKKLWTRYKRTPVKQISHPSQMGRPESGMTGRREHSAVLSARYGEHLGAAELQDIIRTRTGMNIPHGAAVSHEYIPPRIAADSRSMP